MLIRRRPSWFLPDRLATPETSFFDRRKFLGGLGALAVAHGAARAAEPTPAPTGAPSPAPAAAGPGGASTPAKRNAAFTLDRPLSDEQVAARHNIFDEFAGEKDKVWIAAKDFKTRPWKIHVGGLVKQWLTLDVDELVRRFGLEERLYRHRCVEAWAMAVPWTGFPLKKLIELAAPVARAKFVRFVSAAKPDEMPGWYASRRVFPYYEGLSLAEATHDLAFLATGIYGHPLPPQHGAPIRLVVPWKYGFKSIKSIAAIQFTDNEPGTFWHELAPNRYAFRSNVDPKETEPWPQNEETMIGTGEKRPTQPYNGYGAEVASLYA